MVNNYFIKYRRYIVYIIVVLVFVSYKNQQKSTSFFVGAASQNINPAIGAFIAGDKNDRHFAGIHDSIFVKAIVVSDSKNQIAILTFDCIGLLYPTLLDIRKEAAVQIPAAELNPANIVMASTHTHSGPDVVGIWGHNQMSSGVDPQYMKKLVQNAVAVIVTALKNKQPATLHYATTTFGNDWVYNISETGELDRSVSILQFKDVIGKSIATLTNFACHPTIMDGKNSLVSADYVFGMYQQLSKTFGGENLFLQGSIGGWVQPEYEEKTFDRAERRGKELADAVETALKNSTAASETTIQFKSKVFNLPVTNTGFQQLSAAGIINRPITDSVSTEIAWFSIGPAQLVTHPGETVPAYSIQSKKLMNGKGPKFVIGLGMDALGYILKPTFFGSDTSIHHTAYLTGMSIGKDAGPIMMNAIELLAKEK